MTGAIAAAQYSVAPVIPISVQLHDQTVNKFSLSTATATYTIASNGNVVENSSLILEAWLTGTGASASNYEVQATQTSGVSVTGTLGSWLNCGSNNAWSISNGNRDYSVFTGVIAVQIRDVATHTVQASASITISAESDGKQ